MPPELIRRFQLTSLPVLLMPENHNHWRVTTASLSPFSAVDRVSWIRTLISRVTQPAYALETTETAQGCFTPALLPDSGDLKGLIELTRSPGCLMALGGYKLPMVDQRRWGTLGSANIPKGLTYLHAHVYSLPLPELAALLSPDLAAYANPAAMNACTADGVAALNSQPMDNLHWCAGSWGSLYPLSGFTSTYGHFADNTSLLATQALAKIHRIGAWQKNHR